MATVETVRTTETHSNTEATKKADGFLDNTAKKVGRWATHVGLTLGESVFSLAGGKYIGAAVGTALNEGVKFGDPTQGIAWLAAGLVSSTIGGMIGWQGVKNAGSGEKALYVGIKAAYAGVGALSVLINPFLPVAFQAISTASTFIGMRKRK